MSSSSRDRAASRRARVGGGGYGPGNAKPLRRAASSDGYFPANLEHPDQLAEIVATIAQLRQHTIGAYDIAVGIPIGVDPLPYVKAGATWWMPEFAPEAVALEGASSAMAQPAP